MKFRRSDLPFAAMLVLILAAPLLLFVADIRVLDRAVDLVLIGFVALSVIRRFRARDYRFAWIYAAMLSYVAVGVAINVGNLNSLVLAYELKLIVFVAVLLESLAGNGRKIPDWYLPWLNATVLASMCMFAVLFPARRLNIVNEGNYFCMFYGVVALSLLRARLLDPRTSAWKADVHLVVTALTSVTLVVLSASRTGLLFFAVAWGWLVLTSFKNRFHAYGLLLLIAGAVAFAWVPLGDLEIYQRTSDVANTENLDRVVFLRAYLSFVEDVGLLKAAMPFNFVGYGEFDLRGMDYWVYRWAVINDIDVGSVGLAGFHFHSAFLRVAYAHGLVALVLLVALCLPLMKRNPFLGLALLIGSFSMSVPYLSVMLPAAYLSTRAQFR